MNCKKSLYRFIILCLATLTLAACGGGGSSPPPPGPQTWFFPDGAALTDSQINSFDTQGLYFNVHSAANPGGEIRSQINPSSTVLITDKGNPFTTNNFSALLSGGQEVPANTSKATGYSTIVLDTVTNTLSGVVVTSGIVGTAAHIHDGLPGASGLPVVTLTGGPTVWTVPSGTTLTDTQIGRLTAGAYYVNVHTTAAPDGEIRGQLSQQLRFALLNGANEVPAVTTSATGTGVLALNPTTSQISGFVKTTGITGTLAHIHAAAAGATSPPIVPLTETPAGSGIWVVPAGQTLTASQVDSFNAGNLYFNVHSAANPGGEIRGQILAATVKTGTADLKGSNEVPPVTTGASGTGIMALNSVTKQVNGNVKTTGIAGTLAHVHEGAAGVNGSIIIPLTLTQPVSTLLPPLAIATTSLPDGTVGSAYSQSLSATGGVSPYTWSVSAGALPAGLSLSAAGVISGTPTAAGTANFTVKVTDADAPAVSVTKAMSIAVAATAPAAVSFASQIQPIFTANCVVCHTAGGIANFLVLTQGAAYNNLVNISSSFSAGLLRVKPGDSLNSVLYLRVSGTTTGQQMPPGGSISASNQNLIKNWIDQGALNN